MYLHVCTLCVYVCVMDGQCLPQSLSTLCLSTESGAHLFHQTGWPARSRTSPVILYLPGLVLCVIFHISLLHA